MRYQKESHGLRPNRRQILKSAAGGAAAAATAALAAPYVVPSRVFGATAPSNRIAVGVIGTGNRGFEILKTLLNQDSAQIVAVCDVNRASFGYRDEKQFLGREPARKLVEDFYGKQTRSGKFDGCAMLTDFRDVLARNDIDAVAVVVPDHWHALMSIAACKAGKDVYCEKPMSLTIAQGRAMVDAVRQHKRVLQTGSHERSNPRTIHAIELVRSGRIGKLKRITTFVGFNNKIGPGPGWKPMPVPEGFDYATWLGPAPDAPFHQDRCLYRFRFNYDYSGGQVTNFGAHSNDMAQWALGADNTGPTEVELIEAKFLPAGSLFNTALETKFRLRYADGVEVVCQTDKSQVGARFEGTEGVVQTGYAGLFTEPAALKADYVEPKDVQQFAVDAHVRNFLDCVRSRKDPVAHVEIGHRSASVCHLGNIAVRLGKQKVFQWDPAAERFTNDDDANAMLTRPMRGPWTI
ncbi:MAG TPA: Gfo/Idh/MocA family oxidoreductase [Pirellulales bacterium]|nr:Gfo/Idh/MocA family oxidoreductase [Pirellulales bacterium]